MRLATRSSAQARTQAQAVADALMRAHPGLDVQLVFVDTTGDRRLDVPLHQIGGQGVFVKEVQAAVLEGRADLAVHSAKDLTSTPTPGLDLAALCERRTATDALVGRSLTALGAGDVVATGSVRRRAQLRRLVPGVTFAELRGNIATRLAKVPAGGAIVMAVAALEVLDLVAEVTQHPGLHPVTVEQMIPMVGQGCVAVECRSDDTATADLLTAVDHAPTRHAVTIERAFLAELGGGCSLPVAAHVADGVLHTFVADDTGTRWAVDAVDVSADDLGRACERARHAARQAVEGVS
jgi:hydroxymethylbilane synthase